MKKEKNSLDEYVMVFPTSLLHEIGYFQGITSETDKYLDIIFGQKKYEFKKRKYIENDYNYKQIIPYVIFKKNNHILSYRRGKLLTEIRLIGNYSIGVGGHISINDPNLYLFDNYFYESIVREIKEEIDVESDFKFKTVALLNDDSNETGKVHFGIILIGNANSMSVKAKEKSINELRFVTFEDLKGNIDKFENWSKICIKEIDKIIK